MVYLISFCHVLRLSNLNSFYLCFDLIFLVKPFSLNAFLFVRMTKKLILLRLNCGSAANNFPMNSMWKSKSRKIVRKIAEQWQTPANRMQLHCSALRHRTELQSSRDDINITSALRHYFT